MRNLGKGLALREIMNQVIAEHDKAIREAENNLRDAKIKKEHVVKVFSKKLKAKGWKEIYFVDEDGWRRTFLIARCAKHNIKGTILTFWDDEKSIHLSGLNKHSKYWKTSVKRTHFIELPEFW